jgi:hypothetical protein
MGNLAFIQRVQESFEHHLVFYDTIAQVELSNREIGTLRRRNEA